MIENIVMVSFGESVEVFLRRDCLSDLCSCLFFCVFILVGMVE